MNTPYLELGILAQTRVIVLVYYSVDAEALAPLAGTAIKV
jgi:hypothetical protein